ncbi:MAG: phenylalanine--tRNA ligase subunit beta [Syntrophomonadaceae bacterium]|jgi:phenylalanyl-tRNA synthetase beta chain|nr:phenylalanine--tRNA ligase subunit beta [Syntrophomonadaceae bacterium]
MGISINWLKKYVDFDYSVQKLAEALTMAGIAVEAIKEAEGDQIIELDLTPNRGDCLGVINLAREVAALQGKKVKMPDVSLNENKENVCDYISIDIAVPDLCPRYTARVIKNCEIKDSPEWLRAALSSAGVRPVNNIVDVTNYVMLETNQPLHAFDYDLIPASKKILVRTARKGEKMTTLDGTERELDNSMLVITDGEKPIALAGIMGGENTEIGPNTVTVLLESANFNSICIRKTSRALSLRSDSSARFEKGVDVNGAVYALNRAAALMQELGGGEVVGGVADQYPNLIKPPVIKLRTERVNYVLGGNLSEKEIISYLNGLEFKTEKKGNDYLVTVPTYRPDVLIEEDLIEEVARLHGYENLPSALPEGVCAPGGLDAYQKFQRQLKNLMSEQMSEVVSYSFVNPALADQMLWSGNNPFRKVIALANPLSEDYAVMRTSLVPGLLKNIAGNLSRQIESLAFFEMGAVFSPGSEVLANEVYKIAGAACGQKESNWLADKNEWDFFCLKGLLEGLFKKIGLADYKFSAQAVEGFHTGRTASIQINDVEVGMIGEIHPAVQDNFGIKHKVCAFELDVALLFQYSASKYLKEKITKYPVAERDVAFIVPMPVTAGDILELIPTLGDNLIKEITLFDLFIGNPVPAGKKSVALRLRLWSDEKTLTEQEVKSVMEKVIAEMTNRLGAELR